MLIIVILSIIIFVPNHGVALHVIIDNKHFNHKTTGRYPLFLISPFLFTLNVHVSLKSIVHLFVRFGIRSFRQHIIILVFYNNSSVVGNPGILVIQQAHKLFISGDMVNSRCRFSQSLALVYLLIFSGNPHRFIQLVQL